jgi:PAS domain S-box-containing protein
MILDLIRNVALLATLAIGLQMLSRRLADWSLTYQLAAGLLFGGVALLGMMTPIHFAEGVIYDGRSIVLSLAGLFGGPLTATVAAVTAALYRLSLGGAGVVAGVGTVIEATALGVALHYLRRRDERWVSLPRLWVFGLVVHVIMLGLQWLIPGVDGLEIMRRVGPTVLVFFPLAFVLTAFVFLEGERIRRGEHELADTEERLRLALEGADLGVWDWDIPARSIRYDERSVGMLGYTPAEAGPDAAWFESLMHPDDFPRVRKNLDDHFAGLTAFYQAEMRLRHKQGHWVWVLDRGRVIARDAAGNPLRACGTHLEITHAKELADQLRQAQKMESVGQLAGGIAHDYNNMLSVILGHTELALARTTPGDPLRDDLEAIQRAAERSALLTSQLLAFARRQTVAPRLLDLNQVVAGLLDMLSRMIDEDIDLRWHPAPATCPVTIDPSQLDQILTNLAVNARDAIGGVGKLTIETALVEVDASYVERHAEAVPGPHVMLVVSDDGSGMDSTTLARIFDPFFTTKPRGKGTGLGLATVYGIVKQNGGFINVYSEPGRGTTFRIYLPRAAVQTVAPLPTPVAMPAVGATATILLVEDDPTLLLLARRMLENLGHRVLAAGSPGLALELAREHRDPIALLLTDVVMPEMNGRDLWQILARERPGLKCLYMSGYTANVIAHRGVLDAGVDFLQKPFTVQELAVKLQEVLAGDPT